MLVWRGLLGPNRWWWLGDCRYSCHKAENLFFLLLFRGSLFTPTFSSQHTAFLPFSLPVHVYSISSCSFLQLFQFFSCPAFFCSTSKLFCTANETVPLKPLKSWREQSPCLPTIPGNLGWLNVALLLFWFFPATIDMAYPMTEILSGMTGYRCHKPPYYSVM